jgi:hypothetical protein
MKRKQMIAALIAGLLLVPVAVSFGQSLPTDPVTDSQEITFADSASACPDPGCLILPGAESSDGTAPILTAASACPEAADFYREQGLNVDSFLGACPSEQDLDTTVTVLVPDDQLP